MIKTCRKSCVRIVFCVTLLSDFCPEINCTCLISLPINYSIERPAQTKFESCQSRLYASILLYLWPPSNPVDKSLSLNWHWINDGQGYETGTIYFWTKIWQQCGTENYSDTRLSAGFNHRHTLCHLIFGEISNVKVFPNLKSFSNFRNLDKIELYFDNAKDALEAFHSGKDIFIGNWKANVIFNRQWKNLNYSQSRLRSPRRNERFGQDRRSRSRSPLYRR